MSHSLRVLNLLKLFKRWRLTLLSVFVRVNLHAQLLPLRLLLQDHLVLRVEAHVLMEALAAL